MKTKTTKTTPPIKELRAAYEVALATLNAAAFAYDDAYADYCKALADLEAATTETTK